MQANMMLFITLYTYRGLQKNNIIKKIEKDMTMPFQLYSTDINLLVYLLANYFPTIAI